MRLTPMRYKDYIWPSNPGSYRISFRRVVAEHKLPFGRSVTQDLGQVCRVLEGEGEFAGEGAYEEFKRLATVARYHTVVQGDTLWAIAARNGTTVRALCALNPQIANPNRIYPGERVRLS